MWSLLPGGSNALNRRGGEAAWKASSGARCDGSGRVWYNDDDDGVDAAATAGDC